MDFTLRFFLGLIILVLTTCNPSESGSLWRRHRQVDSKETITTSPPLLSPSTPSPDGNNSTNYTEIRAVETKPKTEHSTELYVKDKLNRPPINNNSVNATRTKEGTREDASASVRIDNSRSLGINVDKYLSPDFHNKNNVFTLSPLPTRVENENGNAQQEYIETTPSDHHFPHTELTTPSTKFFDDKFQKIEEGLKQNLEYIDHQFKDGYQPESRSEEIVQLRENATNTTLNYFKLNNYNIDDGNSNNKGSYQQGSRIEGGEITRYSSNFSTHDNHPKDYKNKIPVVDTQASDTKTYKIKDTLIIDLTTPKPVSRTPTLPITKRPNRTEGRISLINNKIESESVKTTTSTRPKWSAFNPIGTNIDPVLQETSTRTMSTTLMKRGSTKFQDTVRYTTVSSTYAERSPTLRSTKYKTHLINKENMSREQEVSENQVSPNLILENKNQVDHTTTTARIPIPETTTSRNVTSDTSEELTTVASTTESEITTVMATTIAVENSTVDETTLATTISQDYTSTTMSDQTTTEEMTTSSGVIALDTTTESTFTTTIESAPSTLDFSTVSTTEEIDISTTIGYKDADNRSSSGRELYPNSGDLNTTVAEEHVENLGTNTIDIGTLTTIVSVQNETVTEPSSITTLRPLNVANQSLTTDETLHEISNATDDCEEDDGGCIDNDYSEGNAKKPVQEDSEDADPTKLMPKSRPPVKAVPEEITTETASTEVLQYDDPMRDDGNSGTIAAITISCIGAICLVLLAGLLFIIKKRHKRFNYGQRCRPVSLDAYSVDNVSVYNSVRRKGAIRSSKRSYGNPAFDDPENASHLLNYPALAKFATNPIGINAEFEDIPQVTVQMNELPEGCDTKNRYANVIPLPETRVHLKPIEGVANSDYINANYITGPKGGKKYYIATQAPLQNTVDDFWKMVWEQQSRVILMLTHHYENGVEKCFDYLPPSEVLDCHRLFGDFQVTLKKREVKERYIISNLQLKNMVSNSWREITQLWYMGWPEKGVPVEANSLIAFLIEARSYVKVPSSGNDRKIEENNGNISNGNGPHPESSPVIVHCSPGTGRTGTVIACDIAIREFELNRQVDIPKTVYRLRRDRASAVQTKEQYAFIYKVISLYATKLTGEVLEGF